MSAEQNVAIVSYVSPETLSRVQQAAKQSNRSTAGMVREIIERALNAPKIERR
jgi:predicted DNA-binding protein